MARNIFKNLSARAFRGLGLLALFVVVMFFAATRTQYGRDGLSRQIEKTFNNSFEGTLEIGLLTGNILNSLFASDIRVLDLEGNPVLEIDSLIVEPRWLSLLQREFSVSNITLIRPRVFLDFGPEGSTKLEESFRSRSAVEDSAQVSPTESQTPWSLVSASLVIIDGSIVSRNPSRLSRPDTTNFLIDFSNSEASSLHLEARIDWMEPTRVIDIIGFSALLTPEAIPVNGGQAQLLVDDERFSLNEFALSIGNSNLRIDGWINQLTTHPGATWNEIPFVFNILSGFLDFDELKTLLPGLPISGSGQVKASINGPLNDLAVAEISITSSTTGASGASGVNVSGTVSGLPEDARFEFSVDTGDISSAQLQEWFPDISFVETLAVERISFNSYLTGSLSLSPNLAELSVSGNAEIRSSSGSVSSSFEISGARVDSVVFDVQFSTSGLDLAGWTNNPSLESSISGTIGVVGAGPLMGPSSLTVTSELSDFSLGEFFLPELNFTITADTSVFLAELVATQLGGTLKMEASGSYGSHGPIFSATTTLENFDLGTLLSRQELTTDLTVTTEISGQGSHIDSFIGQILIVVDSSIVSVNGTVSTVPPHTVSFLFQQPDLSSPRLSITGDILELDLRQNMTFSTLFELTKTWGRNTNTAVQRALDKPLYARDQEAEQQEAANNALEESLRWDALTNFLAQSGQQFPIQLDINARILRPEILFSYFPSAPSIAARGTAELKATWTQTSTTVSLGFDADSLLASALRMDGATVRARYSASYVPSIDESAQFNIDLQADSVRVGGQKILSPQINLAYASRTGTLNIFSPKVGPLDSLVVDAGITLLPDRARLQFERIEARSENTFWSSSGESAVEWYSDALLVRDIQLNQQDGDGLTGQSFNIYGRLSNLPVDTLHVNADNVILTELSDFADLNPHFGGLLNAQLAFTRTNDQPVIAGSVDVERMSVDSWIIGDLAIRSSLVPGSPDITVNLSLQPGESLTASEIYGTARPALLTENRIDLNGTIRLPGNTTTATDGALNLRLDIDRVDLFFFEYIFGELENVTGFVTGDGQIRGTMKSPEFDINMGLYDGIFYVPITNLTYQIESNIRIDAEAINFRSGTIRDPSGGVANISGQLRFNDYRFFTLDLALVLDEFQIMNVGLSDDLAFYGFLWASGDLTLQGPLYDAELRSANAVMSPNSELFLPVSETAISADIAYIVFEDELGKIPDFKALAARSFILGGRPDAERRFLDALDMDLSILAPQGSTLHLVIDPLLGDVINARSSGRVQLQRVAGEFFIFGTLDVDGGDYLFTAGDLFVRRFLIDEGGTMTWSGDPVNAVLDIPASYRTRASTAGLSGVSAPTIPLFVTLLITGTVDEPEVELGLVIDRSNQNFGEYQAIEAQLNSPEKASEYATSVLLTNSFQFTTDNVSTSTGSQLAFNSVSQLVSTQLNRFLAAAVPNVDFTFGLQGDNTQDIDVTYGVALRLLDEKLIIRGEGLYQGSGSSEGSDGNVPSQYEGMQGEFVVEVRLSPRVSVEVFFRRESDIIQSAGLRDTSGAGVSYQTEFSSWGDFFGKMTGWIHL